MAYSDEIYERIMGFPRPIPAAERTPEQRQASWNEFLALMDSFSEEELAEDLFVRRPLNTSILEEEGAPSAHTA